MTQELFTQRVTLLLTTVNFGTALFTLLLVMLLVDCIGTYLLHKAYKELKDSKVLKVLMVHRELRVLMELKARRVPMERREPRVQMVLKASKVQMVRKVFKGTLTVTAPHLQLLTQLL
jgi:hypothetical protein